MGRFLENAEKTSRLLNLLLETLWEYMTLDFAAISSWVMIPLVSVAREAIINPSTTSCDVNRVTADIDNWYLLVLIVRLNEQIILRFLNTPQSHIAGL